MPLNPFSEFIDDCMHAFTLLFYMRTTVDCGGRELELGLSRIVLLARHRGNG